MAMIFYLISADYKILKIILTLGGKNLYKLINIKMVKIL